MQYIVEQDDKDEQVIAVITAAIAMVLNRSTHDIFVKTIRRTAPIARPWNQLSRQEQTAARLNT